MNTWLVAATCLAFAAMAAGAEEMQVRCVKRPPTEKANAFYVSNRQPLEASRLVKLPIGAITPRGWVRRMLDLQRNGFIGRLTEISRWCKAEDNAWLSPEGKGHSPWEELPYWLKGYGDMGYVLGDEAVIAEARKWIEGMLGSQQPDGWFGPVANKTASRRVRGKPDLWPNMIALNCLQSYFEFSGDKRVLDLMARYFRWQLTVPDDDFLPPFWQQQRASDNLESVHWLYNRLEDKELLKVSETIFRNMARWDQGVANWHGVNISQCFRAPTVYWPQGKTPELLQASYRNYDEVMGLYGQVPGGMFGADENCRRGFDDPRQGAESCTMVEFMHSFQMLTRITGDPLWADRCEEVAFNSYPCSQTPDLKGLHYLTAANQVVLDARNHSPGIQNGGCMFAYNPHSYRCCQHNISHGWPYYAEELWLATADGGLCASLYAESEVEAKVGDGTTVRIVETTQYPFSDTVRFAVSPAKAVRFPLYLRIPRWCEGAAAKVNGQAIEAKAEPLSFLAIERTWQDGDQVALTLPMQLKTRVWAKNHGAVSIDRGPLTYSLKIGEEWKRYGGTDAWPAFEVLPTTPWNYGLEIDPAKPEASIQVEEVQFKRTPVTPFVPAGASLILKAKARKIPEWTLDRHGLVAVLQDSPVHTAEPLETVTLIPMGCARLRICSFPVVSTSPDARTWEAPPQPAYRASASHCHGSDSVDAMCDSLLPKSSGDTSIPRMTWWDRKGSKEWVAYRLQKPTTVSEADVYWFDDTGRGQCRVPASWRLLYREGKEWKEVKLAGGAKYGTAKDAFNKIAFEPVTAAEFRLEVQLQPDVSGGILEWRIGPRKKK